MIASATYYRMGRVVLPLGLCLGAGSMLGAYFVPMLTAGKINLSMYVGYFGICVFAVGGILFYETTATGQARRQAAKAAAKAFEDAQTKRRQESAAQGSTESQGVSIVKLGIRRVVFKFYGVEFSFNPVWPVSGRNSNIRNLVLYRSWRRISLCALSDIGRRFANVHCSGHLRCRRTREHDHININLYVRKKNPG